MQPTLSRQQAKVLADFLEQGPFRASANVLEFRFPPRTDEAVCVAVTELELEDEKGVHAFCSLPSGADKNILVTVSDGEPDKIADIVARLTDHARTNAIAFGHTLRLEKEDYMRAAGRVATILLRVDAVRALADFPEVIALDGNQYPTHLIVFLDQTEYQVKMNKGLVPLLDHMEGRGRDLVRFVADERLS
jgi:hypothetical protein